MENHPEFALPVRSAMAARPGDVFAVSPLVKLECLIKPLRTDDLRTQRRYETGLSEFVQLALPEAVFLDAARLRARFNLKTPDALHLACAQHHRCASLWTNDERLAQASHGLAINIL
jgi:predicted nucleic acid-binding protein